MTWEYIHMKIRNVFDKLNTAGISCWMALPSVLWRNRQHVNNVGTLYVVTALCFVVKVILS